MPPDLAIYLEAAYVWLHGGDPYAARIADLAYVYPPWTVPLFAGLVWMPSGQVMFLWSVLLVLVGAALVGLWRSYWSVPIWMSVPVGLLAFNRSGWHALDYANIALGLHLLVFVGLTVWVQGRPRWAAACWLVAGCFKPSLWAFLPLLLLVEPRRVAWWSLAGVSVVSGLAALLPGPWAAWRANVAERVAAEHGWVTPAALPFWRDLTGYGWAWVPWSVLVVGVTLWAMRDWVHVARVPRVPMVAQLMREHLAHGAVLVYLVACPWVKCYDYLLAIPTLWLVAGKVGGRVPVLLLACGGIYLAEADTAFPWYRAVAWQYYPWLMAVGLWAWLALWSERGRA